MTQNGNSQKSPAPLISLRRSYNLKRVGFVVLSIGLWIVLGVFGLLGQAVVSTGRSAGWAYLVAGLVMLPTLLSYFELRSWVGHSGGSYRLIRAVERNNLTFYAGWLHIFGWAAISSLLIYIFGNYAGRLIVLATGWTIEQSLLQVMLIAALLFLFVSSNIFGSRAAWRAGVAMVFVMLLGIAGLMIMFMIRGAQQSSPVPSIGGTRFFGVVALLVACQWTGELLLEAGDRRHYNLRIGVMLLLGGPLVSFVLAISGYLFSHEALGLLQQTGVPNPLYFPLLVEAVFPGYGELITLGVGTIVTGLAWQIIALVMLRRFQIIGMDGWLPRWLMRSYTRFRSPVLLIFIQAMMTPVMLGIAIAVTNLPGEQVTVTTALAGMASIALLLIYLGVNTAAILLHNNPRAQNRSIKLPLHPVFPAVGSAISFLLLFAIPLPSILLIVGWLGIGGLYYWRVGLENMRRARLGITVFQDVHTQQDITSKFPVVVPVANPETALHLVAFGAAIAKHYGGHVNVVQILKVPDQQPLVSERLLARESHTLLEDVLSQAQQFDVPIEGVTRLSRSISQGILDTISEENARMLVIGWNARQLNTGQQSLGHIIDEVLENAPCDVAIVRGEWHKDAPASAVVPVAGGANAPRAAEIALALTAAAGGKVTLLNITRPTAEPGAIRRGKELLDKLGETLSSPERAVSHVATASTPARGIVDSANEHDVLLLGTSEGGMLEQQYFGKLPLEVAQNTTRPLVLVRGYTGITSLVARKAWVSVSEVLPTLTPGERVEIYHSMRKAAQPTINYFVLIAASALISTLGLLLNSPAVIIGAMLVAPLMSPIVSAGVGIVSGDIYTVRNALTATLQGVLIAIFLSTLATVISPISNPTPEILARTQPNLLDLMVALVSGVAGAYALGRKEVGEALPGVAIAAALMPPVCTVGVGIALGSASIAFGALFLFVTNLIAIIFAAAIIFLLLGMRPPQHTENRRWLQRGLLISIVLLVVISLPLGFVLLQSAQQSQLERQARLIIEQEAVNWENARLADVTIETSWRNLVIKGTLYSSQDITDDDIQALDVELESTLKRDVSIDLFVVTGQSLQSDNQ